MGKDGGFNFMKSKKYKGYTLLEVLVVVLIMATLTYLSIPLYNELIHKSDVSDALHNLDMFSNAQSKYFIEHGGYADNLASLATPLSGTGNQTNRIVTTNFIYSAGDPKEGNYCIYSQHERRDYVLARNYKSNSNILCSGSECDKVKDFVERGDLTVLCGDTPQGGCNLTCTSPKVLDDVACKCVCTNVCSNGQTPNPTTCECGCSKEEEEDCRNLKPNFTWHSENCSCTCDRDASECEEQGKTLNPTTCSCESNCNWTPESCAASHPSGHYVLKDNCQCECGISVEDCEGKYAIKDCVCTCRDDIIDDCNNRAASSGGLWQLDAFCDCKCPIEAGDCVGGSPFDEGNCKCECSQEIQEACEDKGYNWMLTPLCECVENQNENHN